MLTLRDVMSAAPQAVLDSDPVDRAATCLARRPGQPLLVVDGSDTLVGVLGDADLLRASAPDAVCARLVAGPPRTMSADTPLIDALHRRRGCHGEIIVVMDRAQPVGTFSELDVARIAQHVLSPHEQVGGLSLPTRVVAVDTASSPAVALDRLERERGDLVLVTRHGVAVAVLEREEVAWAARMGADRVGQIFRRIVFSATPRTTVRRAAHDMIRTRCRALPVQDSAGRVCAVVTLDDIGDRVRELLETLPVSAVA